MEVNRAQARVSMVMTDLNAAKGWCAMDSRFVWTRRRHTMARWLGTVLGEGNTL